jgi:hypothetical protein
VGPRAVLDAVVKRKMEEENVSRFFGNKLFRIFGFKIKKVTEGWKKLHKSWRSS